MEGAKDPDEFIKKYGAERFSDVINKSKTRFDFELEKIIAKYNLADYEDKIKASSEACRLLASFPSEVEREVYTIRASKVLEISQEIIKKDVSSLLSKRKREEKKNQMNEIYRATSGIGDRINPESASNIRANKVEEAILGLMQLHEEHFERCIKSLTPDDFVTSFSKKVFGKMLELHSSGIKFDIAYFSEDFSQQEVSRITKMLTDRQVLALNGEEVLNGCIESLRKEKNKKESEDSLDSLQQLLSGKK